MRRQFVSDDGATAVEYGLLVAAIAAVIVLVVIGVGTLARDSLFTTGCQAMNAAQGTAVDCTP
jgi:pilus assembly protein Flp/PilA